MSNPIAKSYARLVEAGRRTLESVPEAMRAEVEAILSSGEDK